VRAVGQPPRAKIVADSGYSSADIGLDPSLLPHIDARPLRVATLAPPAGPAGPGRHRRSRPTTTPSANALAPSRSVQPVSWAVPTYSAWPRYHQHPRDR